MNVLLIGSGGREHALAWSISQSRSLGELHAAPGNPGHRAARRRATRCPRRTPTACSGSRMTFGIDLVVVGPEAPLVAGVADALRDAGVAVFGPGAAAARIEGSKTFAKDVMTAAGVPTALTLDTPRAPCVVKADGLAAGKGVFMCRTEEELAAGLEAAAALGGPVVVEEWLDGEEVSRLRARRRRAR